MIGCVPSGPLGGAALGGAGRRHSAGEADGRDLKGGAEAAVGAAHNQTRQRRRARFRHLVAVLSACAARWYCGVTAHSLLLDDYSCRWRIWRQVLTGCYLAGGLDTPEKTMSGCASS